MAVIHQGVNNEIAYTISAFTLIKKHNSFWNNIVFSFILAAFRAFVIYRSKSDFFDGVCVFFVVIM